MRYFERRNARVNFYKECLHQVEEQGYWVSPATGVKVYDTAEHLKEMINNTLRAMC